MWAVFTRKICGCQWETAA